MAVCSLSLSLFYIYIYIHIHAQNEQQNVFKCMVGRALHRVMHNCSVTSLPHCMTMNGKRFCTCGGWHSPCKLEFYLLFRIYIYIYIYGASGVQLICVSRYYYNAAVFNIHNVKLLKLTYILPTYSTSILLVCTCIHVAPLIKVW